MREIIIGYKEHKPGESDPLWTAWEQTGELVRCKDCEKYDTYDCPWKLETGGNKDPDWFCADGERRTDDA